MKLLKLTINNFKGISSFELPIEGNNAIVSGTNGAGKTSLFDAYSWLLFGKDSAGRSETNFEVKPHGSIGLTVEVVGEFEHEDKLFTLGKTLTEKFAKINGESEAERKPKNEYTYYINGVPKPKSQYTAFIADICPEETFRLLSDPDYFAGKIDWKERRKMLIDYFGTITDAEIISKHDEIKELAQLIGNLSVDDYKMVCIADRKKLISELDSIPNRIDEAEKAKPEEMPLADDAEKLNEYIAKKQSLELKISDIRSGVSIAEQRNKVAELQVALATAKADYTSQSAYNENNAIIVLQNKQRELETAIEQNNRNIGFYQYEIKRLSQTREKLLETYRSIAAEHFDEHSTICPTCGREYPAEKTAELRAKFNSNKAKKQEENIASGTAIKAELQTMDEKMQRLFDENDAKIKQLEALRVELATAEESKPKPFEETITAKHINTEIDEAKHKLNVLISNAEDEVHRVQRAISELNVEITIITNRLNNENAVKRQDERIEELKRQAKALGKRRAELDHGIELASTFEQLKLSEIENSVNSQFKYASFKLFNRQINGGLAECCEVTVNGIPYNTNLNTAAKANAGLDIINVISKKKHVTAPIWLDGAESVVDYIPVESQTIQLAVDGNSDKLRIYVEE